VKSLRLEDMKYFVEIVRSKSLNKASAALYVTQPALGTALKNFEDELGTLLLYRSATGIKPTILGRKVYQDCSFLLNEIQTCYTNWQQNIHAFQTATGTVQIGTFPLMSPFLASSFAKELKSLCPHIQLSVHDLPLRHDLQTFSASKLPIAIGLLEKDTDGHWKNVLSAAEHQSLQLHILARDQLKVLINSKNPLAKKHTLSEKDLQTVSNITYFAHERETSYYPHPNSHTIYAHTLDQILQMVQEDIGVFLAGEKIASKHFAVQNNLLKIVDLQDTHYPPMYIYILHLPDDQLTDAEKAVLRALEYYYVDGSADDFFLDDGPNGPAN